MNLKLKISNLKFIALSLSSLIYILACSGSVNAQQVNLSFDPPIVQAKIKPGKAIIIGYNVENTGDPTNLQFLIRPFTPVGELGSLSVNEKLEGPVQFNLENADLVLEKPFFFPSRQKKQAVVRIAVPVGVPDGDYYYLVMAQTVPAFSVAGLSTGIASASIGSPLLISITESGITEVKATIAEFSFKPDYIFTIGNNVVSIVDNAKELPITCSVRNMGKNLIQAQGTITDQSGGKKTIYTIVQQNILSNSQRVLKVFSDNENDQVGSTLVLPHLSIGSHTVVADLALGDNGTKEYRSLSFLALPLRLISILCIALIGILLYFLIRFLRKRNDR
jgi:hypothetical protein